MSQRITVLELQKENMKFSAGHFTIFSKTERESLHGHNYNVYVALTTRVQSNGLSYDYRHYKEKIYQLCRHLNQTFLIPKHSPFLQIEQQQDYVHVKFDQETLMFLHRDVTLLEVCNITVEELSQWFVDRLVEDKQELKQHQIEAITIKVFSAPGQSASAHWQG